MLPRPTPFVTVEGEGVATRVGQCIRVPATFSRPLPFVPKPVVLLWSELINAQYMGAENFTTQGCTLVWDAERPGPSHVKATVMLPGGTS